MTMANSDQARRAIETGNATFGEAIRGADAAAIGSLYTDDAILLPPGADMIKGREGIQAFWHGGFQMGIKDAVLTTINVEAWGDTACEIGTYLLKIQPPGQGIVEDNGKYVVVWKLDAAGAWKLAVDIWNSSVPSK